MGDPSQELSTSFGAMYRHKAPHRSNMTSGGSLMALVSSLAVTALLGVAIMHAEVEASVELEEAMRRVGPPPLLTQEVPLAGATLQAPPLAKFLSGGSRNNNIPSLNLESESDGTAMLHPLQSTETSEDNASENDDQGNRDDAPQEAETHDKWIKGDSSQADDGTSFSPDPLGLLSSKRGAEKEASKSHHSWPRKSWRDKVHHSHL